MQGPEPVHAGMLTEYMRHNLGQLFQPRGHHSDLEPQQPTLQTQLSGDDEAKVQLSLLAALLLQRASPIMHMTGLPESTVLDVGTMKATLPNSCIQLLQPFAHSCCQTVLDVVVTETSCLQAVRVSLEPVEAGGEVKLNLAALQQHEEPSISLPAVRTSITSVTSVSPRRRSTAHSPMPSRQTSEIQPLSENHQVGACLHIICPLKCARPGTMCYAARSDVHSDVGMCKFCSSALTVASLFAGSSDAR